MPERWRLSVIGGRNGGRFCRCPSVYGGKTGRARVRTPSSYVATRLINNSGATMTAGSYVKMPD
jgi:hypothetical protein